MKTFISNKVRNLLYYSLTLILGLVLSGAGCIRQDAPATQADYYGTWKCDWGGGAWGQVTLDANKLVYVDYRGYGYTMENLTWEAKTNPSGPLTDSHPTGYIIKGTLTAWNVVAPFKDGTITWAIVGDIAVDYWYISIDKGSLAWGSWEAIDHPAGIDLFIKQ